MLGLMLILVYGVFLLVIPAVLGLFVWRWAIKHEKRRAWSWGVAATLAIPILAFWDYYPTKWTHEYYCKKEAGFWVYKTFEQWKAENPSVLEALLPQRVWPSKYTHIGDFDNYISTGFINQRLDSVGRGNKLFFLSIRKNEQEIVDSKTKEVLARSVDFSTGDQAGGNISPKFWLRRDECVEGKNNGIKLGQFITQFTETNK